MCTLIRGWGVLFALPIMANLLDDEWSCVCYALAFGHCVYKFLPDSSGEDKTVYKFLPDSSVEIVIACMIFLLNVRGGQMKLLCSCELTSYFGAHCYLLSGNASTDLISWLGRYVIILLLGGIQWYFFTRLHQFDNEYAFYTITIVWATRTEMSLARMLGRFNKVSSYPDCSWEE